jgi:4'-phosphopantetheinyl transferase
MMEKQVSQRVLYPVILAVPDRLQAWKGRRHVLALSRLARAAARQSTRRAGGVLGHLHKTSDGVPLPSNGWHWSVAHKSAYVAGVAGSGPLGIDIEPVLPRSRNLFNKIADKREWRLGCEDEWHLFFRFWTAKEAVLKAVGMGLKGLSHCRVIAIDNPCRLRLDYKGTSWVVQQNMQHGHLVAVAANEFSIHWVWPEGDPRQR